MNSELVRASDAPTALTTWFVCSVLALVVVLAGVAIAYSVAYGPQPQADAQAQMAQEVAQENETVCGKLGMPRESQTFAACVAELEQVRQRHEARLGREFEYQ